eukprot:CAMPEP_0171310110 /NCGR_PEP_ID=MMETSP0816-20121228/20339_1 /TAXON_ID=420281 /ORGANISM="Proboscia inermis, Strain CCAP1064/1" /LENGTH=83 /DNA_ID=CAMNT_0011794085 /DNA_START=270 /DNA_END=518 /DNA_ORIENTATION=+
MIYLLTNNSKNSSCCTSSTTAASPLSPSSNKKEMAVYDLEAAVETVAAEQIDAWTVCFMFFISLSGHSIMEGVAIGTQMQPAW